jgi:hypothetical protein
MKAQDVFQRRPFSGFTILTYHRHFFFVDAITYVNLDDAPQLQLCKGKGVAHNSTRAFAEVTPSPAAHVLTPSVLNAACNS